MRDCFRKTLGTYNEIIKEDLTLEEEQQDRREALVFRLKNAMQSEAYSRDTSTGVQYEVFELQQRKQALMQTLRENLQKIDQTETKPERTPLGSRHIIQEHHVLYWERADGSRIPVTLGDVLTDLAWNVDYHLDPVTVPRTIRKKFLIEQTRQRIERLLDLQIMTEESASKRNGLLVRQAYERSKTDQVNERLPFGILAERMMAQLIKKWIIDGNIPFTVRPTDAFQDVTQKIDFVITRKEDAYTRGVQIKKTHNLQAKAIQFTLNTNPEVIRHKQEQIEHSKSFLRPSDRIDDLLLVTMRSQPIQQAYNRWRDLGKPPGGPANLLSEQDQRQIFEKMMEGLIDQDESHSYWDQAA